MGGEAGWCSPSRSPHSFSPEMLPSDDPLPHLKRSRAGLGGGGHEADQHDHACGAAGDKHCDDRLEVT